MQENLTAAGDPPGIHLGSLQRGPGSLQRSHDPLANGTGLATPSPRTVPYLSAFQVSGFGPSVLAADTLSSFFTTLTLIGDEPVIVVITADC